MRQERVLIVLEDVTQLAENVKGITGTVVNEYDPNILIPEFVKLMGDIGHYGKEKHKENSFQARASQGLVERTERLSKVANRMHAQGHFFDYYYGNKHDHFHDLEHQLAAVAFNAMMEFYFLRMEQKKNEP